MAVTGSVAPRVVVRPPNVPTPPPISLLTQNNVDDLDASVIGEGGRWEGGAGSMWLEPLRQFQAAQLWQVWPDEGGTAQTNKSEINDGGSDPGIPAGPGAVNQSPVQRPIMATLIINEGLLTEWALQGGETGADAPEGSIEVQLGRALDAVMPRVIERELWTSGEVAEAHWATQFRLKTPNVVTCPNPTPLPYLRALARAEQLAADYSFIDNQGGAFIHCTPYLMSLWASDSHGIVRSPSGRQLTTFSGCQVVPEPGATGIWNEAATAFVATTPAGAPAGNNTDRGWLFVTPPVRVRMGRDNIRVLDVSPSNTNDRTLLVERAFILEASILTSHYTSIAVPVDYTTSGA